ncbi:hypothetical protein R3P38DRAFT_135550 [Favolaschia claudopus]|uniref:Uncharacterized protein n=1 Tax=Favolaschia claudopus TaxID=2862362 RepID=A0AAV9ZVT5_9AGAR
MGRSKPTLTTHRTVICPSKPSTLFLLTYIFMGRKLSDLFVAQVHGNLSLLRGTVPAAALIKINAPSLTTTESNDWQWYGKHHYKLFVTSFVEDVCGLVFNTHIWSQLRDYLMGSAFIEYVEKILKLEPHGFYTVIGAQLDCDDATANVPQEWLVYLFRPLGLAVEQYGKDLYGQYRQYLDGHKVQHELFVAFQYYEQHEERNNHLVNKKDTDGNPVGDPAIAYHNLQKIISKQNERNRSKTTPVAPHAPTQPFPNTTREVSSPAGYTVYVYAGLFVTPWKRLTIPGEELEDGEVPETEV